MKPINVSASCLQLGDTVKLDSGPFDYAIVKQIEAGEITLFRPYATTADFSYTGGVICYIGIEEFKIAAGDLSYEVVQRRDLR